MEERSRLLSVLPPQPAQPMPELQPPGSQAPGREAKDPGKEGSQGGLRNGGMVGMKGMEQAVWATGHYHHAQPLPRFIFIAGRN